MSRLPVKRVVMLEILLNCHFCRFHDNRSKLYKEANRFEKCPFKHVHPEIRMGRRKKVYENDFFLTGNLLFKENKGHNLLLAAQNLLHAIILFCSKDGLG